MKKYIFALMLTIAICETCPLIAMLPEDDAFKTTSTTKLPTQFDPVFEAKFEKEFKKKFLGNPDPIQEDVKESIKRDSAFYFTTIGVFGIDSPSNHGSGSYGAFLDKIMRNQ